jgi:2-polyprenyl-6-methoxyphenol hydroxylase-like FAD-dependent oxidoreductase
MSGGSAIIVGGGIGGLATVLALRRAGVHADVYERFPNLSGTQRGGGYTLWYPGVRALQELGLGNLVAAAGQMLERFEFATARGKLLAGFGIGSRGRQLGSQPVAVLRSELHRVLADACGNGAVYFGARCTGFTQDAQSVTVRFEDGSAQRASVVIGADGLRSVIRAELHGAHPPRYPGYGHWFGFVDDVAAFGIGATFRILFAAGERFGLLPVGNGRLCWWCTTRAPEGGIRVEPGIKHALLARFGSWAWPVSGVLEATPEEAIGRRDTYDLPTLDWWGKGRVTLVGDAAHAMTFDLGLGASTTLKDAVMLGKYVQREGDLVRGLRVYEAARLRRANQIARRSAFVGAMAAWRNPILAAAHLSVLALGRFFVTAQYERDLDFRPKEPT